MTNKDYIHGYTSAEKQRLIQQAKFWQDTLILRETDFKSGHNLLEIGCGVGAVLGIIGKRYPGVNLAGIDLDKSQIDFARNYLHGLNIDKVDLKIGDANQLPWQNNTFNYVYGIWFLEHLKNPRPILKEILRVLETEGKVIFNEVDLMTLLVYPDSPDFYYLQRSFFDLQNYSGNGYIARQLGILLKQTGFNSIKITPWSYHYFEALEVKKFVDYVNEWLSVCLGQMVEKLNKDYDRLQSGLKFFQSLPELPESSITATIYRATAIK